MYQLAYSSQKSYKIPFPKYWLVEDKPKEKYSKSYENLHFHISKGDYFGTIATILSLMEEEIYDRKFSVKNRNWQLHALRNMTNDLMYLQGRYKIVPKEGKDDKPGKI